MLRLRKLAKLKLQTNTLDMEFIQALSIAWLPWLIMGAYELFKVIKEKLA